MSRHHPDSRARRDVLYSLSRDDWESSEDEVLPEPVLRPCVVCEAPTYGTRCKACNNENRR